MNSPPKKKRKRMFAKKKVKSPLALTSGSSGGHKLLDVITITQKNSGDNAYGCQFMPKQADGTLVLATVCGKRVSIFNCLPTISLLWVFVGKTPQENYCSCAWSDTPGNGEHNVLLAVGGYKGVIHVLSPLSFDKEKEVNVFIGHTGPINDLKFHTTKPDLLFSASADFSIRAWSTKTNSCLAIFAGVNGHHDQVLSIDIDSSGTRMVSGGMDRGVKVWNFNDMNESYSSPVKIQFPQFSTYDVHINYVDCVQWAGPLIFSKSSEGRVICWKPGLAEEKWENIDEHSEFQTKIAEISIEDCETWFIRFNIAKNGHLYLGNIKGELNIFDLKVEDPSTIMTHKITNKNCIVCIRQIAISENGKYVVCACDGGTVWIWERET